MLSVLCLSSERNPDFASRGTAAQEHEGTQGNAMSHRTPRHALPRRLKTFHSYHAVVVPPNRRENYVLFVRMFMQTG